MSLKPAISMTLSVESIAHLFNYLIQDESVNAPTHYTQHRPLFRQVRDWLEARLLIDADDPEEIDSNALFFIDGAITEIVAELEALVGNCEIIAAIPFDVRGSVIVVLTLK